MAIHTCAGVTATSRKYEEDFVKSDRWVEFVFSLVYKISLISERQRVKSISSRNIIRFPEDSAIKTSCLLVFKLDEQQYALRLEAVERIVRAAAITPLPKAPDIILGILDIQGEIIPVINVRKRFRLPEIDLRPEDQFIIARARSLTVALVVDAAQSVVETPEPGRTAAEEVLSGMEYLAGVTRTEDGLVLIHDLDKFLSLGEEKMLLQAMEDGEV
jgi:purine-binding chemotaxis protein CheW